jgi:hypothetical protein
MNSKDFPLIRPKFYSDELEDIEEERRLFYVACSRAKKRLYLTYHNNMSPLLREINPSLYICNINENINKIKPTLNILIDVKNYLNLIGYFNIYKPLNNIIFNQSKINKKINIPNNLNIKIINKLINQSIFKIIQIKYPTKIKPVLTNIDSNYENIINNLCSSESYQNIIDYKNFLINNDINLVKGICEIINIIKPNEIYINYITSYGSVSGNIDLLCDNHIIYIGSNIDCETICEKLLYTYILKKNNHIITNIIFYNPINGEKNNMDITNIDIINFKKIFY